MIQVTQTRRGHPNGSATATLKLLSGPKRGTHFELPEGQFYLGRSRRCDLRLIDPSINRVHCVLERTPDEVTVRDLNSISGTYVNGKAVRGTWKIFAADVLRVGEFTFELSTGTTEQDDSLDYRFDPLPEYGEEDLWTIQRHPQLAESAPPSPQAHTRAFGNSMAVATSSMPGRCGGDTATVAS